MLEEAFKKPLRYLKKHHTAIQRSFEQPYSNLEGKNNLIKVIQRVAFGFRIFKNLKKRILIQQGILFVK